MCTPAIVLTLYSNFLSMQPQAYADNGEKLSQRLYKRLNKEEVHPCEVRIFRTRKKKSIILQHFHASHGTENRLLMRKKSGNP